MHISDIMYKDEKWGHFYYPGYKVYSGINMAIMYLKISEILCSQRYLDFFRRHKEEWSKKKKWKDIFMNYEWILAIINGNLSQFFWKDKANLGVKWKQCQTGRLYVIWCQLLFLPLLEYCKEKPNYWSFLLVVLMDNKHL